MAQAVPNLCVSRIFFETSSQLEYSLWCNEGSALRNIWLSDDPVEVLNEQLFLLVGRYVPTKVIRVRNKDKARFDDPCRRAFGLEQEKSLFVE